MFSIMHYEPKKYSRDLGKYIACDSYFISNTPRQHLLGREYNRQPEVQDLPIRREGRVERKCTCERFINMLSFHEAQRGHISRVLWPCPVKFQPVSLGSALHYPDRTLLSYVSAELENGLHYCRERFESAPNQTGTWPRNSRCWSDSLR
jgi:hypothetical protein